MCWFADWIKWISLTFSTPFIQNISYHHHHISFMELGHLLTRSVLTYPEVSSKVYHDSFCQLGSSISLPWVIYYVFRGILFTRCIRLLFYSSNLPKIGVIFNSFAICAFLIIRIIRRDVNKVTKPKPTKECSAAAAGCCCCYCYYYYYYYYYYYRRHHHHHLLHAGYLYLYSWDKLRP